MTFEHIRQSIESARKYLSEHPDQARYTDRPATAVIEDGLRCRIEGLEGVTDMPAAVGGGGSAPTPGWLARAAQASCDATVIAMRAAELGVQLQRLEVTVDSESDDRGLLGMDEAIPAGPLSSRIRVRIEAAGVDPEQLRDLVEWADRHSPVSDAVRREVPTHRGSRTAVRGEDSPATQEPTRTPGTRRVPQLSTATPRRQRDGWRCVPPPLLPERASTKPPYRLCKQRVARVLSNQLSDNAGAVTPHAPTVQPMEVSAAEPPRRRATLLRDEGAAGSNPVSPTEKSQVSGPLPPGGLLLPAYSSEVQQLRSFQELPSLRSASRVASELAFAKISIDTFRPEFRR
jgi:uncharacterized OsmC-like protein